MQKNPLYDNTKYLFLINETRKKFNLLQMIEASHLQKEPTADIIIKWEKLLTPTPKLQTK